MDWDREEYNTMLVGILNENATVQLVFDSDSTYIVEINKNLQQQNNDLLVDSITLKYDHDSSNCDLIILIKQDNYLKAKHLQRIQDITCSHLFEINEMDIKQELEENLDYYQEIDCIEYRNVCILPSLNKRKLIHQDPSIIYANVDGFLFRSSAELDLYMAFQKYLTTNIHLVVNQRIICHNKKTYELDFLFITNTGQMFVLELNGDTHKGKSDYDHDRRRAILDTFEQIQLIEYYSINTNTEHIVQDFLKRINNQIKL